MVEIFCSGEERELWEDVLTARGETAKGRCMKFMKRKRERVRDISIRIKKEPNG